MAQDTKYSQLIADLAALGIRIMGDVPLPPEGLPDPLYSDVDFIGEVYADGDKGLTGTRTVGGWKITFKKGLLTGFEQA